jgi:hypothetical protein
MSRARLIRWDEAVVGTPWALSQLSHKPKFPVINTNIGEGQNMLITPHAPVLHIATLARPATWGYFVLDAQRGIAWYWWFPVFACFTVLFLLIKLLLNGHDHIAAFGAFWFSASAFTVGWSNWPAYFVLFPALGVVAAHWLLTSKRPWIQLLSGLLLGLSVPGFTMMLYPAWQVPLGYLVLFLFAALIARDRLHVTAKNGKGRVYSLAIALIIAIGVTVAWLLSCLPALRMMTASVYPGGRVSTGGDFNFERLFRGVYNFITLYDCPRALVNESESASFYYFFPAAFVGLLFAGGLIRQIGIVGKAVLAFILLMLFYLFVGFPARISQATLFSYIPSNRADLTIGLASIIASLQLLVVAHQRRQSTTPRAVLLIAFKVAAVTTVLFLMHARSLGRIAGGFPSLTVAVAMSLIMGAGSFALMAGLKRTFCTAVGVLVIATSAWFNPLATNLDHIYKSELATKIQEIESERSPGDRSFWLCYGGNHEGALVYTIGGRSLSGIQWPPQLSMWRVLDPSGSFENTYNMYAEIYFAPVPSPNQIQFTASGPGILHVRVAPNNSAMRELGVRYVVVKGSAFGSIDTSKLEMVYQSPTFTIYKVPDG